jgi:hypothetical protein
MGHSQGGYREEGYRLSLYPLFPCLQLDPLDDQSVDGYGRVGFVLGVAGHLGDFLHYVEAFHDFSKDGVLAG